MRTQKQSFLFPNKLPWTGVNFWGWKPKRKITGKNTFCYKWILWQQKEQTLSEIYEKFKNYLFTIAEVKNSVAPQEWKYH